MSALLEAEATLTSQNQITIPANIRKHLQLGRSSKKVKFQILPTGKVMVVAARPVSPKGEDPALRPFLKFLEEDLRKTPQQIKPFPKALLKRAKKAVTGIKVDLDAPLTGED